MPRRASDALPQDGSRATAPRRQRGQALALFVLLMFVLLGMVAIVVDVSWFWANRLHMQRAADAAALAGAVHLPGDPGTATTVARAEAAKNGYTNGVSGFTVTPQQSATNARQLNVTISGPVNWTFAQVFNAVDPGKWNETTITVKSKAQFVHPVPMGSPDNYYGVGYLVDTAGPTTSTGNSRRSAGGYPSSVWSNPGNVGSNDNAYASASANGAAQQWRSFGFDGTIPDDSSLVISGIRVRMQDLFLTGSGTATNCQLRVELSWNSGANWSTVQSTSALNTSTSADYDVGSATSTSGWGSHTWTRNDLLDANFRVRLTWVDGSSSCASTQSISLDDLDVHVDYSTSSYSAQETDVLSPTGQVLAPHNFWGAMNSQGAPAVQGDAYLTKYDRRTSSYNCGEQTTLVPTCAGTDPDAQYLPDDHYNYGVEIPAGASGGEVWIFDPGFCESGSSGLGTGEFWTVGGANGYSSRQPISAFFDLWDTQGTPYNTEDDTLVASSNNTFRRMAYQDHDLFAAAGRTPSEADCGSLSWHHGWWRLASGLSGGSDGTVYRVHTYSTDFGSPNDQDDATGHNTFAIWATASGGTPRVYGIDAMEAFVRLPGGQASEFYLAQIEEVHAGKTLLIELWDPGDTGSLSASLEILKPTSGGHTAAQFSYSAEMGSSSGTSSCNSNSSSSTTAVTTNTGGTSLFNGCWLKISIQLPSDYDAPQDGWWKIRYTMGGSTSAFSTDLTTWQVGIRGSPVHLLP